MAKKRIFPSANAKRKIYINAASSFNATGNERKTPPRFDRRWVEQWDLDSLMTENVDLSSSQASFAIPLVQFSVARNLNIGLSLVYNSGEIENNGLAGNGWLLDVPQECITVDYGQGVFPDRFQYYFMLGSQMKPLTLSKTEGFKKYFTLDEDDSFDFIYDASNERWIVDTPNIRSVFGKTENSIVADAVQTTLSWTHWRGPGSAEGDLQPEVNGWYLVSRQQKHGERNVVYYDYQIETSSLPNFPSKVYTSIIQLKSVRDGSGAAQLNLKFGTKSRDEYGIQSYKDFQGRVQFPLFLQTKLYLAEYTFATERTQQTLRFYYDLVGKRRLLKGISQIYPQSELMTLQEEQLLQFMYAGHGVGGQQILTELRRGPLNAIKYQYSRLQLPLLKFDQSGEATHLSTSNMQVTVGEDFSVLSNHMGQGIVARIMDKQLSKRKAELRTEDGTQRDIQDYAVVTFPNLVVILEETKLSKILFIFNRDLENEEWNLTPAKYSYTRESMFRYTSEVFVIAPSNNAEVVVFEPDVDKENKQGFKMSKIPTGRNIERIIVDDTLVLVYNGRDLSIILRPSEGASWQKNDIALGVTSQESSFLEMFQFDTKFKQDFKMQLRMAGLQMAKNMVLLSTVGVSGTEYSINAYIYLLSETYKVARVHSHSVQSRKNLEGLEKMVKAGENDLYFKYKKEDNGKFTGLLYDAKGKIDKDIEDACKGCSTAEKEKLKKDMIDNMNKDEAAEFRKLVLFETEPFFQFQLDTTGAKLNSTKLHITGSGWESKPIPKITYTTLGKNFVLESSGKKESRFRLFKQAPESGGYVGSPLLDFTMEGDGAIAVGFPSYLAYQIDSVKPVIVIPFTEDGIGGSQSYPNEQLLTMSNAEVLITSRNQTDPNLNPFDKWLVVRKAASIIPSEPMWVLARSESLSGEYSRVRNYESEFRFDEENMIQENVVKVVPNGDKSLAGWYEEVTNIPVEAPRNATKFQKWYSAQGEQVRFKEIESSEEHDEEEESCCFKIKDITGDLEIGDMTPYNATEKMVAYYGFETYESGEIPGTNSKWSTTGTIVKNGFPFTGERYLHLSDTKILEGTLTPEDQLGTFVASTWVRDGNPDNAYQFGHPVEYFKATLKTHTGHIFLGIYAEMKRQMNDWTYLELTMDLEKIRTNVYAEFYHFNREMGSGVATQKMADLPLPNNMNITITLQLDAEKHPDTNFDVDHIRFIPIQHNDFKVTIYNPKTGSPTAEILANGAVMRKVYNKYHKEIATINGEGSIDQLVSGSNSGEIFPKPKVTNGHNLFAVDTAMRSDLILKPESGSLETFDRYSLRYRWQVENPENWSFAKNTVLHHGETSDVLQSILPEMLDPSSSAIRFYLELQSRPGSISAKIKEGATLFVIDAAESSSAGATLNVPLSPINSHIENLPLQGEVICFVENTHIWIWWDGVLLVDRKIQLDSSQPWQQFFLEARGNLELSDLVLLKTPQVLVEYYNAWGDQSQVVQLEDENTVLVSEKIYDNLGREAITTKAARLSRKPDEETEALLNYHFDFATNKNPKHPDSVFKTGLLHGKISDVFPADEGYAYHSTLFLDDMLREAKIEGLPGKQFSALAGTFNTKHSRKSNVPLMRNLFPLSNGYLEKVVYYPNGSMKVTIIDARDNEIAEYVRVPGHNDIITTYEFNSNNQVIMMLPPNYHKAAGTFLRTTPWPVGHPEEFTEEELEWQRKLGSHFKYTDDGQLETRLTPDEGTREYVYDAVGNLRFMYNLDPATGNATNAIYVMSQAQNRPVEVGYLKETISVESLKQLENSTSLPGQILYQRAVYSDYHTDPNVRGKTKLLLTYENDDPFQTDNAPPFQELLQFDDENKVTMKTSTAAYSDTLTYFNKRYKGGRITELQYPQEVKAKGEGFRLLFSHDKMGRLVGLGDRSKKSSIAVFQYDSTGQVEMEQITPGGGKAEFSRKYKYNSPGLLEIIEDPFFSETNHFTNGGYGQSGHGEGIIMQSKFTAPWAELPLLQEDQQEWFRLPEETLADDAIMKMCIHALKRTGFVDEASAIPTRYLGLGDIRKLPLACGGKTGFELMKLVAAFLLPAAAAAQKFSYGNHKELIRSKYINEAHDNNEPLQMDTFLKEIDGVTTPEDSETIWDILIASRYIIVDQSSDDKGAAIGKQSSHDLLRTKELEPLLEEVGALQSVYAKPILTLLFEFVMEDRMIPLEDFQETYVVWLGYRDKPTASLIINRAKATAKTIYEMLGANNYLSGEVESVLNPQFTNLFQEQFKDQVGFIALVLDNHFRTQIGNGVWDFESYDVDPNGNHKVFYVGLNKVTLDYKENSNQVSKVTIKDPYGVEGEDDTKDYDVEHDLRGNVIKAKNRNVDLIKYHPVHNRPILMELTDGRKIVLKYDAQGERVLKRVFDSNDKLLSEVKYLRDEKGNVLMDKRAKYGTDGNKVEEIVSTYIYGPRGLLGFMRGGQFYGVITDHAGSIRLVVQRGKVVAGYDYWPYGETMRSYGNESASIFYRFTGQEYDEETGLYNYHARLYDPSIGRFLQPDPKAQYFSPYVYAGNSPINLVDPDGEFFFLLAAIICAVVGAFLGGAAANGSWNPLKWDWKSASTWLGIVGGALAGAALPSGFIGAVAQLGFAKTLIIGIGTTYLSMVPGNGWNPAKWDWKSPALYNGFFQGFSSAMGMATGIAGKFDKLKNIVFKGSTISKIGQKQLMNAAAGLGMAYLKGAMQNGMNFKIWEWNWKDPTLYMTLMDGFSDGKKIPASMKQTFKDFAKLAKTDMNQLLSDFKPAAKEFFKSILKDKHHPLWKIAATSAITYINISLKMGSFDLTDWEWNNWKQLLTYEAVLNGIRNPIDVVDMVGDARKQTWADTKDMFKSKAQQNMRNKASQTMKNFAKGMKQLSRYWNQSPGPVPFGSTKFAAGRDVVQELQQENEFDNLVSGMFGTSNIYTEGGNTFQYLDCAVTNATTSASQQPIAKCDITLGDKGKVGLQNRELVQLLFIPTKKYQQSSTESFVPVDGVGNPAEYLEYLATILKSIGKANISDEEFLGNFFIGAVYYSLITTSQNRDADIFIRNDEIETLNVKILHIALVSNGVVSMRSIIISDGDITSKFAEILEYIRTQKFGCQLQEVSINSVVGEVHVLQCQSYKQQIFVATPKLNQETFCDPGNKPPQFSKVSPPELVSGETLFSQFETFILDEDGSIQREEKLKKFVEDANQIYAAMLSEEFSLSNISNRPSFLGFFYGMMTSNFQRTYDLNIQLDSNSNLYLIARQNGNGFEENWHATPFALRYNPEDPSALPDTASLYEFALVTFSSTFLIANLIPSEDPILSVETRNLPSYNGVAHSFYQDVDEKSANLKESLKHVFFYHQANSGVLFETEENLHFVSGFVLGELIAMCQTVFKQNLDVYIYAPLDSNGMGRLTSQRLFLLVEQQNGIGKILNIIESSKVASDGLPVFHPPEFSDIPALPVELTSLTEVKIFLNINSKLGWAPDKNSMEGREYYFFQGIESSEVDPASLIRDDLAFSKLEIVNPNGGLSFDPDFIKDTFQKIADARHRNLISSDVDFEALAYGFFMGMSILTTNDLEGLSLSLKRSFLEESSVAPVLSLLTIEEVGESQTPTVVVPQSEQVLSMNLKYTDDSSEAEMEKLLEEGKQEIDAFFCTKKKRLEEALKVAGVPVVMGADSEKDIYLDVKTQLTSGENGTCESRPRWSPYMMHRYEEHEPVHNSATPAGKTRQNFQFLPFTFPSILYSYLSESMGSLFGTRGSKPPSTEAPQGKDNVRQAVQTCQTGAWVDDGYIFDGITCFSTGGRVSVFHNADNSGISKNDGPPIILGDKYDVSSCTPIEFNGKPSVACKGKKTTFVYTPYHQDRLFDNIDGNIMLGRVLFHLGSNSWRKIKGQVDGDVYMGAEGYVEIPEEMVSGLKAKYLKIEEILTKCENDYPEEDWGWARECLADCREMLAEVCGDITKVNQIKLSVLGERMEALRVDLLEQLDAVQVQRQEADVQSNPTSMSNPRFGENVAPMFNWVELGGVGGSPYSSVIGGLGGRHHNLN